MAKIDEIRYSDKVGLYFTSLWLLFFLIIIVTCKIPICFSNWEFIGLKQLYKLNIIPFISLVLLIVSILYLKVFDHKIAGTCPTQIRVKEVVNKNFEHLTFLTTYIIPLICFDLSQLKYAIVLLFLLISIGVIYVKTDMFYANPTLALLGFHIYEVKGENQKRKYEGIIVITREKVEVSNEIKLMRLDEKIYYGGKA